MSDSDFSEMYEKAATEIERLRASVAALRERGDAWKELAQNWSQGVAATVRQENADAKCREMGLID